MPPKRRSLHTKPSSKIGHGFSLQNISSSLATSAKSKWLSSLTMSLPNPLAPFPRPFIVKLPNLLLKSARSIWLKVARILDAERVSVLLTWLEGAGAKSSLDTTSEPKGWLEFVESSSGDWAWASAGASAVLIHSMIWKTLASASAHR